MSAYETPSANTGEGPVGLHYGELETSTDLVMPFVKARDNDQSNKGTGGTEQGRGSQDRNKKSDRSASKPIPVEQTERFNLRTQMRNASEACEKLIAAVENHDPAEMAIAGSEIVAALSNAAKYKRVRERNWFQALTVLHGVVAPCDFETIGIGSALVFKNCVEILNHSGLDRTDLNALRRELRSVGESPWTGISPKEDSSEEES